MQQAEDLELPRLEVVRGVRVARIDPAVAWFDVENHPHPQVPFVSDHAALTGEKLVVDGRLEAAGKQSPLELTATVREVDGELEIDAGTHADHGEQGMSWSPLGILRAPSTLIVRGPLVRPRCKGQADGRAAASA